MLSYLNDPAVKEKFTLRFAAHRAADEVIQGEGFNPEKNRGCFVGCTLDNYDHSQFPEQLGWPQWLAHLADEIFEGIPASQAPQFGTDLLAAVPVGKDLEPVRHMIAISRHERQIKRLEGNTEPYAEQCRTALQGVIDYCKGELTQTNSESAESAESARSAAGSAEAAAWSAESAESAAWSAESAAESAAWSAAESAAWSAAESDEYQIERDTLLAVLRAL